MDQFQIQIVWALGAVMLFSSSWHTNATVDLPAAGISDWEGKPNHTSKLTTSIRLNGDPNPLSPLVHIIQAFDNTWFPNVVLTLDCRTDQGVTLPEAFVGPDELFQIVPDISSDPNVCWSCAVRWEEASKWNDFWVYSHGTCEMPLACDMCLWNVDDKGFYLFDPQLNEWTYIWTWNYPIPPDNSSH